MLIFYQSYYCLFKNIKLNDLQLHSRSWGTMTLQTHGTCCYCGSMALKFNEFVTLQTARCSNGNDLPIRSRSRPEKVFNEAWLWRKCSSYPSKAKYVVITPNITVFSYSFNMYNVGDLPWRSRSMLIVQNLLFANVLGDSYQNMWPNVLFVIISANWPSMTFKRPRSLNLQSAWTACNTLNTFYETCVWFLSNYRAVLTVCDANGFGD